MESAKAPEPKGERAATGELPAASGLLGDASALWHELRGALHDQLQLAVLEAKLAGTSLATMVAAGVMVALLLVTAWLGLVGAGVLWLIGMGVAASIAMLMVVAASVVFALALCYLIRRQSRHLQFPATLRSLRPMPTPDRSS
ncbi:MAG TPA: hypothetical protein VMP00_11855 [Burkholderiales bacterium]|nr:hypothetical protein [Burkholderiales bacterium]